MTLKGYAVLSLLWLAVLAAVCSAPTEAVARRVAGWQRPPGHVPCNMAIAPAIRGRLGSDLCGRHGSVGRTTP